MGTVYAGKRPLKTRWLAVLAVGLLAGQVLAQEDPAPAGDRNDAGQPGPAQQPAAGEGEAAPDKQQ